MKDIQAPVQGKSLLKAAMEQMSDTVSASAVIEHEPLFDLVAGLRTSYSSLKSKAHATNVMDRFISVRTDESTGDVIISGTVVRPILRDIVKLWRSHKIEKHMFKEVGSFRLVIEPFFCVELMFMFEQLGSSFTHKQKRYETLAKQLFENTWLSDAAERPALNINRKALKDELTVSLLDVQENYLTRYSTIVPTMDLRGSVLGSAPGSGKTIAGFAWGLAFDMDVVIFIVPIVSLHEVWEDTLKTRLKKKKDYWISDGGKKITGKEDYIICHYEALATITDNLKKFKGRRVGIWVDESHNFNEEDSLRTRRLISICNDSLVSGVTLASGTPLKGSAKETSPMLAMLAPNFTDEVAVRFKKGLSYTKGTGDIIRHRLGHIVYSVPKSDVVVNEVTTKVWVVNLDNAEDYTLPKVKEAMEEFIRDRVEHYGKYGAQLIERYIELVNKYGEDLEPDDKGFREYKANARKLHVNFNPRLDGQIVIDAKRYEKDFIEPTLIGDDLKDFRKYSSLYKYPSLVIRGEALGRVLTAKRIDCFNDIARHGGIPAIMDGSRKKTVVFSTYVETVDVAVDACKRAGLNALAAHGSTGESIDSAVTKFRTKDKYNPLIATYKSLSTAVPLIEASTLVLLNYPYRDYEYQQTTARIDRLGQDGPIDIVEVILDTGEEPNLTTRGRDIMQWSKEVTDFLLGETYIDIDTEASLI